MGFQLNVMRCLLRCLFRPIIIHNQRLITVVRPWRWQRRRLEAEMAQAQTCTEWRLPALALDASEGKAAWKELAACDMYDSTNLQTRLHQLREARLCGDVELSMRLLRENLDRGICGLSNPNLYTHCAFGTKKLIHEYNDEVVLALQFVVTEKSGLVSKAIKAQVALVFELFELESSKTERGSEKRKL